MREFPDADGIDHRQYHSLAQQEYLESKDALHSRLGQLALVNQVRAKKL